MGGQGVHPPSTFGKDINISQAVVCVMPEEGEGQKEPTATEFIEALKAKAPDKLRPYEVASIYLYDNPDVSQQAAAQELKLGRTTIKRAIERLSEYGWEKPPTPQDGPVLPRPSKKAAGLGGTTPSVVSRAMREGAESVAFDTAKRNVLTTAIDAISNDTLHRSAEMYEIGQEVYLRYAHLAHDMGITVLDMVRYAVEWMTSVAPHLHDMEEELKILRAYMDTTAPMLDAVREARAIVEKIAVVAMVSDEKYRADDIEMLGKVGENLVTLAVDEVMRRQEQRLRREEAMRAVLALQGGEVEGDFTPVRNDDHERTSNEWEAHQNDDGLYAGIGKHGADHTTDQPAERYPTAGNHGEDGEDDTDSAADGIAGGDDGGHPRAANVGG